MSVLVGGAETLDLEAIAPVSAAAFAAPPYSERDASDLLRRATRHVQRAGFALAVARDEEEVVGFAYGTTADPRIDWIADLVHEPGDVFELVELAVHPEAQGRGVGTALLAAVLANRPETVVVLQTHDGEGTAMHVYERAEFRRLGATPVGVAMMKRLR